MTSRIFLTLILLPFLSFSNLVLSKESKISVTTFNAGLAYTFVPLAEQRKPLVIQALQNHNADVLCLQEIMQEDMPDFISALEDKYQYYYLVEKQQRYAENAPVCGFWETFGGQDKFLTCVLWKCKDKTGDDFTSCVLNDCGGPFENLKQKNNECVAALIAQVNKSKWDLFKAIFSPHKYTGLFAYEGGTGLMLFSKYELKETHFLDFTDTSTSAARGVLYAKTEIHAQDYHLFCTHLTPDISHTLPYTGIHHSNWAEENLAQTQDLIDFTEDSAKDEPQLVAGDFNHGPGHSDASYRTSELEKHYNLWLTNDYLDPIDNNQCSWCKKNRLIEKEKDKVNKLIDHVFVKNVGNIIALESSIIFDELFQITDEDGNIISLNLSDHFGVNVELILGSHLE